MMPKWLLFGLAAIGNFAIAVLAFNNGRILVPAVLAVAGLCFLVAALGSARGIRSGGA
jgi:hypothetical protein